MTALFVAVTGLGVCVADELVGSLGGVPERVCLFTPGAIAWDGCDCGQLAVTVDRIFYSSTFPAEDPGAGRAQRCGPPWLAADVTVSLLRCAPGPDAGGNPPTCAQLLEAARIWDDDAVRIRRALGCCLLDMRGDGRVRDFVLRQQLPAGPEGGCVGVVQTVTLGFPNCTCPG